MNHFNIIFSIRAKILISISKDILQNEFVGEFGNRYHIKKNKLYFSNDFD